MRRQRAYTIYDKSEIYNIKEIKVKNYKEKKLKIEDLSSEEENELLSLNSNYKIKLRELTLKEEEENEERELYNLIYNLNEKYKNKEYEDDLLNEDKSSLSNYSNLIFNTSNFSEDENLKNIILHNVKNYDKIIKIMLIGEKKVGKTLFLNKIFNKNYNNEKYDKTEYLNIRKTNFEINNKNIKFEFWDSNEKFLNSILVKTYFKISNAFIIIINEKSNFQFLEKQIKEIQSVNKLDKIFFVFNYKYFNNIEIKKKYEKFCKEYHIDYYEINLFDFSFKNIQFKKFLEKVI